MDTSAVTTSETVAWHRVGVIPTTHGDFTARAKFNRGWQEWDIELDTPDGRLLSRVLWCPPTPSALDVDKAEHALTRTLARHAVPAAAEAWAGGDVSTARVRALEAFDRLGGAVRPVHPETAYPETVGAAGMPSDPPPAAPQKITDCMRCGAPETRLYGGLPLGVCGACWHAMTLSDRRALTFDAEQHYRQALQESRRP